MDIIRIMDVVGVVAAGSVVGSDFGCDGGSGWWWGQVIVDRVG